MDRTAWIVVTLCILGLVAWEVRVIRHRLPTPQPIPAAARVSPAATVSAGGTPGLGPTPASAEVLPTPAASTFPEKQEVLGNGDIELHLTNRGGGISEVVLPNYAAEEGKRVTLNSAALTPIGAIMQDPAAPELAEWTMVRDADGVTFEAKTPAAPLTVRKKFSLPATQAKKDNFVAELDINFTNPAAQVAAMPDYFLGVGSAAPIHRTDYPSFTRLVWYGGKTKGIDVGWFAPSNGILGLNQRAARPVYQEDLKATDWVATSDQFFTTLIVPLTTKATGVWGRRFEANPSLQTYGVEGAMRLPAFNVDPGKTVSTHYELYLGPKLYHRLSLLEHNEAEVMEFGFFRLISEALLNALNTFHSLLGNYAAAILALTATVKLALWPLQNRANASMRRMQTLNPRMQELREKYKDDPTRMNQEVMKLYKEHGVNPVGGCLPMFIQIPIFFGLFTMLRQAVELRGAGFLWIHDLSLPDTVAHIPGMGWPVNVLPLFMAATSFWMTHLTPKSGDPTQQRMMMFTPVIFIIFCYNFAAALALYYTTQNLLTVLQLYVNKRQAPLEPVKVTTPVVRPKRRR